MQGKWMHGISHKEAAKRMTGYSHTHTCWIAYMIGISGLSVPLLPKINLIQCRSSLVVKNGLGGSGTHDLSNAVNRRAPQDVKLEALA
ncbi:MAG TPA: hypothetical protein VHH33_01675 [Nitrososphaeraceae archaeon]|nr:hypothetical protein [Nitrososphaeraceae archaeon]